MTAGVRRGFVALMSGQLIAIAGSYATHLVVARGLGPEEYGIYGVILGVVSTVSLVLTAGLPEAIAKFASEDPARAPAIFAIGLRLQMAFAVVVGAAYAAASPIIARVLNDSSLTPVLAWSALSMPPAAAYALLVGALNGQRRFGVQAALIGGYGAIRFVAIAGLSMLFHIAGAVAGLVAAPAVVVASTLRLLPLRGPRAEVDSAALWRFARPVIFFTVSLNLLMSVDLFVAKALATEPAQVGFYTAAATISKIPYFAFGSLGVVLLPVVSAAQDPATVRPLIRTAVRFLLLGSLMVASVLVSLSVQILRVLYGAAYTSAALPLALLSVSGTLFTLFFVVAYALNGLGQPKLGMRLAVAGTVLQTACAIVFVRILGLPGAAAASCVTSGVLLFALLRTGREYLGPVVEAKTLVRASVAFTATVLIGRFVPKESGLSLLWSAPLGLFNIALLLLSRELSFRELAVALRSRRAEG
jgi:stage V sporulation protein B